MRRFLITRDLGLMEYEYALENMRSFTNTRNDKTPDELWLLQHPEVFTFGASGKTEHLLRSGNIPVVYSDRGGQITYHGPGQCIVYMMVDLRRIRLGVRSLVDLIESSIINLLHAYGISASKHSEAPGVYVAGEKIAALGLRIRRGCSYHGVALNVDMDLSPFHDINPCGHKELKITSMSMFNSSVNTEKVGTDMLDFFGRSLNSFYKDIDSQCELRSFR